MPRSLISLALALFASGAFAGTPTLPASTVASFGGELSTPVIVDGWAYVPTGATLGAWELAAASAPVLHGDTGRSPVSGVITGLVRRGDHLYASWQSYQSDRAGVAVYSIADRAAPRLLASDDSYTDNAFRSLRAIAIANDRLYLFDGESGIHVGMLADPVHPQFNLGLAMFGSYASATVSGNRIYTQGRNFLGGTQIDVWDISTPDAPVNLGGASLDGFNNFNVQFAAPLAVGFGLSVSTHDLSDPAAITEIGTIESPVAYLGVLLGSHAYGVGLDGLDAWNLATPASPQAAGHFDIDTFAADAAATSGSDLLLLTRADRFSVIDAAQPEAPVAVGQATLSGGVEARDLAPLGEHTLIVQANYGLSTVDATGFTPQARFEVDLERSLQGRVFEQIATSGTRAALASWGFGVFVLDIADPLAISELGRVEMPFATGIAMSGNFIYAGTSTNGGILSVIDASNPATPVIRGQLLTSKIMRLALHGQHVFIADEQAFDIGGLRIVDVSNPDAPVQVARYAGCDSASDLQLDAAGTTAYLACGEGLHIVDVSNPAAPATLGVFARKSFSTAAVGVQGARAFITSGEPVGVAEIDVSNPAAPVLVADHALATTPSRIRVLPDGRVVVFGGQGGIHVLAGDAIFANGFD